VSAKTIASVSPAPEGAAKPRVRDRIFSTACDLFYRHGIRAVGVDTIASEAGTNKMSFYRSFGSKDELVAEYLREQVREGWEWWDSLIAPHAGDPRAQIEALFDAHGVRSCASDSRGCALANAAVEIDDEKHPALRVVAEYKGELRRRFHQLAADLKVQEPGALGDALLLLFEGTYLTQLTFHSRHGPAENAPAAARAMIRAYGG
jgi:AcrR family transcriptional regulator